MGVKVKNTEGQAARYALYLAELAQRSSNAAGVHGGSRNQQLRKRRREGKQEARDY